MEKVFTRLAVRAGHTSMTPEIRGIMTKMVQFYSPLIQQYGNHLLGILYILSVSNFCIIVLFDVKRHVSCETAKCYTNDE